MPASEANGRTVREVAERGREIHRNIVEGLEELQRRKLRAFEERLTPEVFRPLLAGGAATVGALDAATPDVRRCAVFLLSHLAMWDEVRARCEALATTDPDEDVRSEAIVSWTDCYWLSKNPRGGPMLARIVASEQQSERIRLVAYLALIHLYDRSLDWRIRTDQIAFPRDVKWDFVRGFLGD